MRWNLPSAVNIPLDSLTASTPNPFSSPSALEKQWRELEALIERNREMASERERTGDTDGDVPAEQALLAPLTLHGRKVILLCYNGDTSRVATSVLRAREIEACSVQGGLRAILRDWPQIIDAKREDERHNDLGLPNLSLVSVSRQGKV